MDARSLVAATTVVPSLNAVVETVATRAAQDATDKIFRFDKLDLNQDTGRVPKALRDLISSIRISVLTPSRKA
jgi:hypothetical protein